MVVAKEQRKSFEDKFNTNISFLGHYVFLETSRPISPGWKARLVSKYVGMRVACLKFWYHAFGDNIHMGELQLLIKTDVVRAMANGIV